MTQEVIRSGRRLIRISTSMVVVTAIALGGLALYLVKATRHARQVVQQQVRLTQLVGGITHLDEVLTMSARLAALTGDLAWEARYRQFEPQLDAAIKEAIRLGPPGSQEAASATDVANLKLVEMEYRSFDLTRAGQLEEAKAALFGPGYLEQKQVYAQGMQQFTSLLNTHVQQTLNAERQGTLHAVAVIAMSLLLLLVAWVMVLRAMRRWQAALLATTQQLMQQTEQLRVLNTDLDQKIHARTAELTAINRKLEQEISERLRAGHVLRESEERFRMLASHAPVGIFMTDPQGDCLFVNTTWCRMTGLTAPQAEKRGWVHAIHPEDADRIVQEWYRCAKAGEAFSAEYRCRTPEGVITWVHGSAIALRDERGTLTGYLGTAVDITARKQAAEAMKQKTEELQTLNNMMMGREERILELKAEVNQLLTDLSREQKYRA